MPAAALLLATTSLLAEECGGHCEDDWWWDATAVEIETAIATNDPNALTMFGQTPLHFAAGFGTPKNINALTKAGADPNAATSGWVQCPYIKR